MSITNSGISGMNLTPNWFYSKPKRAFNSGGMNFDAPDDQEVNEY